ncbi:universal stress protein Slr1230-like isoform X2 [Biomphalaria pfeifferi]|uniref:Universal stress protein Slr1230-like isoform X2 n=1 Tax=Biomphalaria pfeifferi TaxID=112525 RepID=A0AAD8AVB5_BIOPF|nr:universal stress protein Slr1230-like isoform X2 [Biomphalaria pfeifferi]
MASESAALGNGQKNEGDNANIGEGDVPSTYRRILVGMDGTADAQKAFDWYMDNIHQPGDFVYVGYCPAAGSLFNFDNFFSSMSSHVIEFQSKVIEIRNSLKEKLKQSGVKGCVHILGGTNAGQALIKEAETEKIDLIILGSRDHGIIRRALLGSVCGYVVHHSQVPVLVYHPPLPAGSGQRRHSQSSKAGDFVRQRSRNSESDTKASYAGL